MRKNQKYDRIRVPGVRTEYPALREAQSDEVGGLGGESRGKDRCDKRHTGTPGTHIDLVHGTGGSAGRSVPAYDGHPSSGFGYRAVSSRRRVSIAFYYHVNNRFAINNYVRNAQTFRSFYTESR